MITKAWQKWLDKWDGSCGRTVELESKYKNIGSPLVVLVDLNNMVHTTSATNFAARRFVVRVEEMREETQWDTTTSPSL